MARIDLFDICIKPAIDKLTSINHASTIDCGILKMISKIIIDKDIVPIIHHEWFIIEEDKPGIAHVYDRHDITLPMRENGKIRIVYLDDDNRPIWMLLWMLIRMGMNVNVHDAMRNRDFWRLAIKCQNLST
ncbi:hypothetical protein BDB01DRAFT_836903 [Pilobolus umbonatus]|nr:hypothetical protein BDB01DRAFT_836903 [Pilobolus umbonatus]